jgi:hypothetical protein
MRASIALLVGLSVLGCSRREQPVEPSGGGGTMHGPTTPGASPGAPSATDAEQKAIAAARELLRGERLDWGEHTSIAKSADGKSYWIQYPTPDHEMKVLGPRSVTVNIANGKAALVMRD